MDKELRQQIDRWTADDEDQKVIDLLERMPAADRGFEEVGLLARAYNYVGQYEKALDLLRTIQEEGEQDTNWNYRMGYALYYLERYKESLLHFTKAHELDPEDEDTVDFIRWCNTKIPFRSRVDDFWQWFVRNEAELSKMVEKRGECDPDEVLGIIEQGTNLIGEDVRFNIGGDYEFTFSVEGNSHLFYLYPYLISRMPEQLRGKWHFFPFNQGTDVPFDFQMYGAKINMAEVCVDVEYNEERNVFSISFYEQSLCALPETEAYNAFFIMMEIMLGEGISYHYIADVDRAERQSESMISLAELRRHIAETLNKHGKKVFENPQEVFSSYQLEPQENEELRYDVAVGSTCFSDLVARYYQNDTELFDSINRFGAQAVFLAFPCENGDAEQRKAILELRYALEDRIEKEVLKSEGLGLLLGGALGVCTGYMDFLLYDVDAFVEKIVPILHEYPQYSFYLSDFRQHCRLTRLTEAAEE